VEDDVLEGRSINTIFQLFGRVGRVGKSWVGFIHVGDKTGQRLMDYIQGKIGSGTSDEAKNLNLAVQKRDLAVKSKLPDSIHKSNSTNTITLDKLRKNKATNVDQVVPPKPSTPVVNKIATPKPSTPVVNKNDVPKASAPPKPKYVPPFRRNTEKDDDKRK
jgi:hypothetical protein